MKVLIAVDETEASRRAVDFAARLLRHDAETIVVNVSAADPALEIAAGGLAGLGGYPGFATIDAAPIEEQRVEAMRSATDRSEAIADAAGDRLGAAASTAATGDPVERVVQLATDEAVDLVIVGTRDPGIFERILSGGSTSREIVDKAPCSVMVVR
jgi:nucleotide-binding universal stress UspA family protein